MEITEDHVSTAFDLARRAHRRWPFDSVDDLEDDALWGLYNAWATPLPASFPADEFPRWVSIQCWYEMKRGMVKRARRQRIASPLTITDDAIVPDPLASEDAAIAAIEMQSLLAALLHESTLTREAVLRIDTDDVIGKRFGIAKQSVAYQRKRFLRDYNATVAVGLPYRSTANANMSRRTVDPVLSASVTS